MPSAAVPAAMFPQLRLGDAPNARARGRRHGEMAQERCRISRGTYARLFAECGIDWPSACAKARAYRDLIAAVDAELVDEITGIAEGSGLTEDEVLALNCRSEILSADFLSRPDPAAAQAACARNRALGLPDWLDGAAPDPAAAQGECTAIAVAPAASADGHTWLAQNWDWMGRQRAALVLLHTEDGQGTGITTLTEAGMLAKIGINTQGFALGLNILRSHADGLKPGVPVHVLLRHLLGLGTVAEARARLAAFHQRLGFGAASNIPCADAAGEVACFEVAPAGWDEWRPRDGVVVHSNHFLCAPLQAHQVPPASALSTELRLAAAQRHADRRPLDRAALEAFLRDEGDGLLSICRSPDLTLPPQARVESVAGVLIDCHARTMWVAPDVPSRAVFQRVG